MAARVLVLVMAVMLAGASEDLVRPDRIVGGEPVAENDALWQVSIQTKLGTHFCGGTLVAANWVLTAAHCTYDHGVRDMRIALGTNDLRKVSSYYDVEKMVRNGNYDKATMEHDIALLKLDMMGREEHKGTSIPLEKDENLMSDNCRITGFGRLKSGGPTTDRMMSALLPLRTYQDCVKKFSPEIYRLGEGHICAGGGEKDACQGDSGGPLVCCQPGVLRSSGCNLVGVVSWGIGCATPDFPGVYTKVAHYRAWVEETIANN